MRHYLRLLAAAAVFFCGHCLAVQTVLLTAKAITGSVAMELPGSTDFSPISPGTKFPVGATIRTDRASDALISILPGFCVKISGNSLVTFTSVSYDEDTSPPRRSVLIDLHSGRLVAIVERYFPGRTSFFVQTGELGGNLDAKDKSVALGGAWGPDSCGAVSVTSDSGFTRVDQVVGTGSWTQADGTSSQIPVGDVLTDSNGNVSSPSPITGDAAAREDQAYTLASLRDAIADGLIDPNGCPGFGGPPPPIFYDNLLGLPLNPANAAAATSTSTKTKAQSTPTPAPTPTPTPPPVISPSSLFERLSE